MPVNKVQKYGRKIIKKFKRDANEKVHTRRYKTKQKVLTDEMKNETIFKLV